MSTNDIATLLNLQKRTIQTKKYRLKKTEKNMKNSSRLGARREVNVLVKAPSDARTRAQGQTDETTTTDRDRADRAAAARARLAKQGVRAQAGGEFCGLAESVSAAARAGRRSGRSAAQPAESSFPHPATPDGFGVLSAIEDDAVAGRLTEGVVSCSPSRTSSARADTKADAVAGRASTPRAPRSRALLVVAATGYLMSAAAAHRSSSRARSSRLSYSSSR